MNLKKKNQIIWKATQKYFYQLIEENKEKLGKYDLDSFFAGDDKNFKSLSDIYDRLLHSSQNYQHMPNSIKYLSNRDKFKKILFNFNLNKIAELNPEELYYLFRKEFNVTSDDSKHNSWLKFSKSAIDSAIFLKEFKNLKDFDNFVKMFDYNIHTRVALPLLIDEKINGIGFALACDFLKELGFTNYSKPDVHIKDVFSALELSGTDNLSVFEAVDRMATTNGETPYKIDKVIWAICSGDFYFAEGRKSVKIGPHKKQLIDRLKHTLD